jgi:hypothetical protein
VENELTAEQIAEQEMRKEVEDLVYAEQHASKIEGRSSWGASEAVWATNYGPVIDKLAEQGKFDKDHVLAIIDVLLEQLY